MKFSLNVQTACVIAAIAAFAGVTAAQISLQPPPPAPETSATPSTPAPTSAPASTLPSAQSVLQGLLDARQATSPLPMPAGSAGGAAVPVVDPVAPNTPKATLMREGQLIRDRLGRLVKDQTSGGMVFVFDSDGKQMTDPPMGVIPCLLLQAMENASDNGTRATKFKISAEVTQYRGKNFLYIKAAQTVRDLNQGIGG